MEQDKYIHGFSEQEHQRLISQAGTLADFIYPGVDLERCASILEVGSGVGAQTLQLLQRFPRAHITCVELSEDQLKTARLMLKGPLAEKRVTLVQASAERMPFEDHSFDGAFVCWVLEHVTNPFEVLKEIKRVLKPNGELFVREVFNQLWHIDPPSSVLNDYWSEFNQRQSKLGGDPYIGVRLGRLLHDAGFEKTSVEFRSFVFDKRDTESRNELLSYWRDLFLSGETASPGTRARIRQEFDELKENPESSIFFGFSAVRSESSGN